MAVRSKLRTAPSFIGRGECVSPRQKVLVIFSSPESILFSGAVAQCARDASAHATARLVVLADYFWLITDG